MENNSNIDELLLQTIAENLQNINNKLQNLIEKPTNNGDAEINKDLKRISQNLHEMDKNISEQRSYLIGLPRQDYSRLFTEAKEKFAQFSGDFTTMVSEIKIQMKQKVFALALIGILAISLIISIFIIVRLNDKLQPVIKNDMKYRFMQTLGDKGMVNSTLCADSIFTQFSFQDIKMNVEAKEEKIRKKVEAEMRANEVENEAQRLRFEANKLKKLAE